MITVFTPTYNRARLLPRLFDSLVAQTSHDFEWLIIDDGSVDNTKAVVEHFRTQSPSFPIRYIRQENGGKHRAINRGAKEAQGELFFIVDSDDYLPAASIETILAQWEPIKDDPRFGGLSGYMGSDEAHFLGNGDNAPAQIDCNALDLRYKYHIQGDMAEVFRTEVMREVPFPEIEGERFCPEALTWNRIAQKYILRYFHKVVYIAEYQADGLTDTIVKIRMNSPVASTTHYYELNGYRVPMAQKVKAAINYWRFHACLRQGTTAPRLPAAWLWTAPIGYLMHLHDKHCNKHIPN